MPGFRAFLCLLAASLLGVPSAITAPAAAQTRIENVATFSFRTATGTRSIASNRTVVDAQTDAQPQTLFKRPTRLRFRQLPESYVFKRLSTSRCAPGDPPRYTPAPVSPEELAQSTPLKSLAIEFPYVIELDNQAANHDPNAVETSWITAATEKATVIVVLTETEKNSGIFAAAIPDQKTIRALPGADTSPCNLHLERARRFSLTFAEDEEAYGSDDSLLIDPQGYVFDSMTGEVVDGAIVTVVDAQTGLPAPVFGDDGVSRYPSTVVSGADVTDSGGYTYQFDPGRFRFPLMPPGTYRLKIEPPAGYKAPSAVAPEQLATFVGPNGPYNILDASYSKPFVLSDPEPLNVDLPIDPDLTSQLVLEKTASTRTAAPGDTIQYRLRLSNRYARSAVLGATIADHLPVGMRYKRGSVRGASEPEISGNGRDLAMTIPTIAAGRSLDITYLVEVTPGAPTGEAVNRARASVAGYQSNEAISAVRIKPLLFSDATTIIGRVTEGDCNDPLRGRKGVAGVRLMLEDGTLVTTDRDGLYHFEGVRAGTHVVQLDQRSIAATHEPVACDMDTRQAGSAISRFVEGGGGSLQRVDFQLRRTGNAAATTSDLPVTALSDADAAGGTRSWLKDQAPGIDWLFPAIDHNPRAPALRVVIKHKPGQRVALRINGAPADATAFDGSEMDEAASVAISTWTGIPLTERDNALEARVLEADGTVATTLTRTVHFATAPVRAELVTDKSRLVADGLQRPLIALRLTDRDGKPVRAGTIIGFSVDQPYAAAFDAAIQAQRQLAGRDRAPATARVVGDDGLAFVALQPTTQAGAVHVTAMFEEKGVTTTAEFRPWLNAAAQGWTIVGFGKGTLGYQTLRDRSRALPRGERNKVVTDGEIAVYAKGRVKGRWLLTMAYGSDRRYDADRGLLGTIDPDRYYTVYGDGTRQTYDAATSGKLYLRLEHDAFRALFGDFETGLTETHLARYSRTLNGVKAEYAGKRVTFTGFAARNNQRYARDEIQGNGLSGPYRLTGVGIVPNSDKIRIEVRDRYRSEKIVSSRQLTRHIDYDIDVDGGTVRFREPILSRDADFNPVFIVAEYETEQGQSRALVAGGRAAVRLAEGKVEVGASLLRDESQRDGTVAGVDLTAKIAAGTRIHAEAATGGRDGLGEGRAFEAEIVHQGTIFDAGAYVRQQDADFGLGQQNGVEAGTRKIGADGRVRIGERISLSASAWHQDNLEDVGSRTAGEARLDYRTKSGTIYAGGQLASDTGVSGVSRDSRLLTLGASQRPFGQKLELFGQTQLALGGDNASADFPVLHKLGAAYEVKQGFRLIAEHQIAMGTVKAHQTRFGVDVAPWAGGKLVGTVAQEQVGENGERAFAQYGLNQSIPLGKHWTIDATFDAATTVRGRIPTGDLVNPLHPVASGGAVDREGADADHQAITLGATYRDTLWSWNGRIEYRNGTLSDRFGVTSNMLRTLGEGRTIAAGVRAYSIREASGAIATYASGDIALAWRPLDSRWSVLERFELRHERADAGIKTSNPLGGFNTGDGQVSTRAVNNIAVNYRTGQEGGGHGWDLSLHYGSKYVAGRFGDERYTGYIDVIGLEVRKDISTRVDVGVSASRQHSWSSDTSSFSIGPSVGFSPGQNIWVSAGYNVTGYRDRDFEDARYTRQGPYVTMRMKFDQLSLSKAARAVMGR